MTKPEAEALELFIKDHDTRFQPSASGGDEDAYVLLKSPQDGEEQQVRTLDEYEQQFIRAGSPGPTIEEAWQEFRKAR